MNRDKHHAVPGSVSGPWRPDVVKWQADQNEHFQDDVIEIVTEYAEWRDRQRAPANVAWVGEDQCSSLRDTHRDADEPVVILHPSAILAACDAEADIWWTECGVRTFVEAVRSDPSAEGMEGFARQCFVEGAYRGAAKVAAEYRLREVVGDRQAADMPLSGALAATASDREVSKSESGKLIVAEAENPKTLPRRRVW